MTYAQQLLAEGRAEGETRKQIENAITWRTSGYSAKSASVVGFKRRQLPGAG